MTRAKVVDRVRKLERLTRSPNKHEAAQARRQASALKRKHRVTDAEVGQGEAAIKPVQVPLATATIDPAWRKALAEVVASRHGCRVAVLKRDGSLTLMGKARATVDAWQQFHHVTAEIDRACLGSWTGNVGALARVWFLCFRAAAVGEVTRRLGRFVDVPRVQSQERPADMPSGGGGENILGSITTAIEDADDPLAIYRVEAIIRRADALGKEAGRSMWLGPWSGGVLLLGDGA